MAQHFDLKCNCSGFLEKKNVSRACSRKHISFRGRPGTGPPPHMSKILISKIIIFMSKILRMKGSGDLNSSINRKLNIS